MELKKFYHIHEFLPTRDKLSRARSLQARMQQGKVFFPNTREIDEIWKPEFMAFPASRHDDTVDACAYAALMLEDLLAAPALTGAPAPDTGPAKDTYDDLLRRQKRPEKVSSFNLYGKAKKPTTGGWHDEGTYHAR
jgi:hypothetical protein